ncbi:MULTISPECIES: MetQ/NlpA family ABC transporter substrate-binding protein [Janthinobacterium]|uniref:Lipoprotein n=1 Tax=Janthinobacterium kumbetense TaxID=2950280 RepID=A0ABT0WW17_9BURK|nr:MULTISPECIES: MetQ/NlpA family ABC transporter substrate-binding protein [Janthinobacterium]MCM2568239.1 MetQ/NlpA family ABC transporter substrate-binding protein [Janthinobacterium kumbetense]MDN2714893.1 MetQ/NlpA family ABC transporter substrate-binding protein [Janthinobacterium sp. SUN120]MDO8040764.1 MetQ/NlpA family ABC transporter substrate-binding protein [Janthinobacterium sp. SUN137]
MTIARRSILLTALTLALASSFVHAKDPKDITIGTSAGPYADQIKLGIKPILEKQGYKVKLVEFNDYIQPNFALAEGSLDANVFQHIVYLKKFALEHKLALTDLITIPTAPIAIYSKKHKTLDDVKEGTTVGLPNDPTNQARALVLLDQLGWIKLRASFDPVRASEKDIAVNTKKIKLLPLEAAQLPRSLGDTDYSFINGNYALASGLKLTDALVAEKISPNYINLVAIRTADKDKQFAKDLAAAYRSREFLDITNKHFAGYSKPDYQQALQTAAK